MVSISAALRTNLVSKYWRYDRAVIERTFIQPQLAATNVIMELDLLFRTRTDSIPFLDRFSAV